MTATTPTEPGKPVRATDRLFLALFPDEGTAARLAALAAQVCERHGLRGKPLQRERLHVTLFHLGDWAGLPPERVKGIAAAVSAVRAGPVVIRFDEVATFPSIRGEQPQVLKATTGNGALHALHARIGSALQQSDVAQAVAIPYEPHITLAYDRSTLVPEAVAPVSWTAKELVLVHSLLGQRVYQMLQRWPLLDE